MFKQGKAVCLCLSSFQMLKQYVRCEQVLLSDDAVAAFSKEIIFLVKFSLVLSDGHIETLLLKVRLLLLTDGGFLQYLRETEPDTDLSV